MDQETDKSFDWHAAALKGDRDPIDADNPKAGFYRTKAGRDGPYIPIAFWYDSATGALTRYYERPWRDYDAVQGVAADKAELREAFERAVLNAVPHRVVADRLLADQFFRVVDVETPEIDDFARRIDLCLEHRLRLSEHRCAIDDVAPRRRQEFGGFQQNGRAVLE